MQVRPMEEVLLGRVQHMDGEWEFWSDLVVELLITLFDQGNF